MRLTTLTVGFTRRSSAAMAGHGFLGFPARCLVVSLLASVVMAQAPVRKNVLILNEVGLAHPASTLVTERVMSRLAADHRYQTEFYVESLDSPLFSNETPQQHIAHAMDFSSSIALPFASRSVSRTQSLLTSIHILNLIGEPDIRLRTIYDQPVNVDLLSNVTMERWLGAEPNERDRKTKD